MKSSIITIVYNNIACIQSVISQIRNNIEHIIIDGKSNDETQQKIAPYIPQQGSYLSGKDCGLSNTLKKGIKVAR
jgi:glycosyltransferase involved in cell wall biosynthesis